jgi:hypothetical protein
MARFYVHGNILRAEDLTPGSTEDCLQKWEALLSLAQEGFLVHDGGLSTCAYCQKYHQIPDTECSNCPIKKATGCTLCWGTSYASYVEATGKRWTNNAIKAALDMCDLLSEIWQKECNGQGESDG